MQRNTSIYHRIIELWLEACLEIIYSSFLSKAQQSIAWGQVAVVLSGLANPSKDRTYSSVA